MAISTYPTYVVNQDWTTFTANQPGASYTGNPNTYVYAVTGFGSIFKTIVDGNLDHPTLVPGAVGVAIGDTLASPIDLTAGKTIAVVKGDFVEEAAIAQANADYTLDFSSIYDTKELSTKFVGSFVAAPESNVGFVVSSKTVYFGAEAVVDEDEQITNRTTITLNRTDTASKWGKDSTFTVGGDFLSDYTEEEAFATATAIVENTDLTVNGAVWVGSGWTAAGSADELFEKSTDAVRYFLTVDDSVVNAASLQVRNTGNLTVIDSTVNTVDVTIRHDASFTNTDLTVNAGAGNFNVYGETGVTATVTLTNSTLATNRTTAGNTDTQFNEFVIGKKDNADRKGVVKLIGSKITGITTTTTGDEPVTTVAKADITVNVSGTLDIDANSSVEAKDVVNKGNITIKVKNDPESVKDQDWISATSFTNDNATGTITIDTTDASLANWNGVKRVIYAESGSEGDAFEAKITVAQGYKVRTSLGKVAIAKGVDYSVYYVNHANDEVAQFAETKTINYPVNNTDYYVAFNAFSNAGIAIGKRETQTTGDPDSKLTTTTILFDGTTEGLSYTGGIQDFDGLTFLRYGVDNATTTDVNEGTYDVTVAMTGAELEGVERVIVKGFTVGEGVTFSADSVVQNGADARTDINGELKILKSNVKIVPEHPELGYVPSFRVGGGALYVNEGAKLTSEVQGNLDVNATNRVPGSGTPIPATMTVNAADVDLYQLTIGSNATVTLQNMKIDDDTTTDIIEGGAHFNKLQLKNPESSDFAKPKLVLQNTDVIVSEVFDSRYGTVDMDMNSTLRVLVDNATIGGGTFNLTVNGTATYDETTEKWTYTGDLAADLGFYKLVYAPLSADVVLTCNGVVNPDNKQEGDVMGEYMYTSLGGKGLFVMKDSILQNIYVDVAWKDQGYTFGDLVGEGKYFGINAFYSFIEAMDAAKDHVKDTTIYVCSDVTEAFEGDLFLETDEQTPAPIYFKNNLTIKSLGGKDVEVTPAVEDNPDTPDVNESAPAVTVKVPYTVTLNGADWSGIYLSPIGDNDATEDVNEGKTITFAAPDTDNQSVTINVLGSNTKISLDQRQQPESGIVVSNALTAGTFIQIKYNTTVTSTGSLTSPHIIFISEDGVISVTGKGKEYYAAHANEYQIDGHDIDNVAGALQFESGTTNITDSNVWGKYFTFTNDSWLSNKTFVLNSTNTTWTIEKDMKAQFYGDGDQTSTSGTFNFIGSTVSIGGNLINDNSLDTLAVKPVMTINLTQGSLFDITGELKNNSNGLITISGSSITTTKVTNGQGSNGTIKVLDGGILTVTTSGSFNNQGYGVVDVIGGTFTATTSGCCVWNYGIMNLDDATFVFGDNNIRNMNSAVININGDVSVFNKVDGDGKEMGVITNAAKGKVVFGVSNDTSNGAANVDVNIVGGTVAFSVANLTFDMAVTGVNNAGTADEAIASAKLSGGTIFVDKAGITLTDSGFEVPATTEEPIVPAHTVYNNTNFIKIGASGSLTLDKLVAGWNNVSSAAAANNSLVVTGLDIAAGGNLEMDWSQCLTVNGTVTAAGSSAITVTLDPLEVYTSLNTDKLVIADANATEAYYRTFVEDYEAFFTVHHDEEGFVNGLYLDASKFVKVSQAHAFAPEDGWYKQFNTVPGSELPADQGAVDSEAGVVLGIDGSFTNVFLKDKVALIVGSTEPEATLTFSGIFAGGFDVSAMKNTEYVTAGPAKLNMKIHEGSTNVAISAGTFSNAVVVGGDLVKIAGEETKVNYYRVGNINTVIDGGDFVTTAGNQRMIVGGEYYQAATIDDQRVSIGAANLTGDVNLTISGGSFKGYDVYGGNYANQKTFGKYATIDGKVTVTLDSSENALAFTESDPSPTTGKVYGGKIFAGSFGAGAITGDAKVILTGDNDITFEKLFGGSTGDFRSTSGTLESNVEGKRILSFTGFTGGLNDDAVIDGFNTVEISGVNDLNFDVADLQYFNLDVTDWKFAADAEVSGTFAFDFSGDKVDMSALDAGWELSNVTFNNKTQFAFADGIGFDYNAESKLFSLVTLQS